MGLYDYLERSRALEPRPPLGFAGRCSMIDPSYIAEILIPSDRLQARIEELGAEITGLRGEGPSAAVRAEGSVLF